jgi:hypothetical protein
MNCTQVLSYGGGVQSVAMCVLVARGVLPRPDFIVIADTGREAQSTWDYLADTMQPYLIMNGLRVQIAPHSLATVDLYSHQGDVLMPLHTSTGQLRTYCSVEWKKRVRNRWLRAQGVQQADIWIGFTLDERHRATLKEERKWTTIRYPLLELNLTRQDCLNIIAAAGLREPAKSSCWMCPHRGNADWRHLRDNYPDDFQRAIALDEELRDAAPLETAGDDRIWLHRDRVPLSEADIESDDRRVNRQCGMGMCFV